MVCFDSTKAAMKQWSEQSWEQQLSTHHVTLSTAVLKGSLSCSDCKEYWKEHFRISLPQVWSCAIAPVNKRENNTTICLLFINSKALWSSLQRKIASRKSNRRWCYLPLPPVIKACSYLGKYKQTDSDCWAVGNEYLPAEELFMQP